MYILVCFSLLTLMSHAQVGDLSPRVAVLEAELQNICNAVTELNNKVATKTDIQHLKEQVQDLKAVSIPQGQVVDRLGALDGMRQQQWESLYARQQRIEVAIWGLLGLGGAGAGSFEYFRRKKRNGNNASQS